jgi:hypothetical protein
MKRKGRWRQKQRLKTAAVINTQLTATTNDDQYAYLNWPGFIPHIPANTTWLVLCHLLAVENTFNVACWNLKFTIQNTGVITTIAGSVLSSTDTNNEFNNGTTEDIPCDNSLGGGEISNAVVKVCVDNEFLKVAIKNPSGTTTNWCAKLDIVRIKVTPASGSSGTL